MYLCDGQIRFKLDRSRRTITEDRQCQDRISQNTIVATNAAAHLITGLVSSLLSLLLSFLALAHDGLLHILGSAGNRVVGLVRGILSSASDIACRVLEVLSGLVDCIQA